MKKDGKYRFSLQFAAVSERQIQVGDFLERLGNRKSAIVVDALAEYLVSHPELTNASTTVTVRMEQSLPRSAVEKLIRSLLNEYISSIPVLGSIQNAVPEIQASLEQDVAEMLGNLDMFL